ncbi:hypothetical protein K502DRAFT_346133 [Neoconidiobolus thromboides FSU 785]|nr:hypothetical protein K502DRAFT_346133 [Neoconidiobolus thromboides FSU 785]
MSLSFDLLSDLLLEEIFELLDPVELFELRYLSKHLFGIVNRAIESNLTYSIYNEKKFYKLQHYQAKFIKQNGKLMKHINIGKKTINYLHYCPNLKSIKFEDKDYYDTDINIDMGLQLIELKLLRLKRLDLELKGSSELLNIFKGHLNQIEIFKYEGNNIVIKDIIDYLNPDCLKSLKIHSYDHLDYNGLDTIKTEFSKLEVLQLKSGISLIDPTQVNSNIDFITNLKLEIEKGFCNYSEIKYFGNLYKFNSIKLVDAMGAYFENDYKEEKLKLIEGSNINTLGRFDPRCGISYDFLKLSNLKKIHIAGLSKELLRSISLVPHIQSIHINPLNSDKVMFTELDLNNSKAYNQKYKSIQCRFIKQIKISDFSIEYKAFTNLLYLFPNLKVLQIKGINLMGPTPGSKIGLTLTTPLLLIISIYYRDSEFHHHLRHNTMIDWIWQQ